MTKTCLSNGGGMKHIFTVEVETDDNIIGTKEVIAAVLESFGRVTFPKVENTK